MAKKIIRRRKANKSKSIEVRGHKLTAAMYAEYQGCIERRKDTNSKAPWRIEELALGDFLSEYRPSHKIKDQLLEITQEAISTSLAIGSMRDFTWCHESDSITDAGCELVTKLALDLYNASAKLTAIAMSVKAEETTKLQDWLAREAQIACIGRGAEVARG
jgi:hypothetical protein